MQQLMEYYLKCFNKLMKCFILSAVLFSPMLADLSFSLALRLAPLTQRALTVLMVVSGAVLVYFVVRTVRMRRRNRKTRRYGVLDTNIENMELTPLEQDDEDDNNTLFDANHPRR
ncbi:membrane protein FAM174A [Echinops telfairi]|uniref:Transmembrane protein 157 n=1 Tax=Echinops telfairi TaxID=9371 RepID=A0ABM0ISE6_ECHTE|nr:membrane protein FAM174A [Echinops telfairi]